MSTPMGNPEEHTPWPPQPVVPPPTPPGEWTPPQAALPGPWAGIPSQAQEWQPQPPRQPSIWPVLLVTFFFGLFGLIPTIIYHSRARRDGYSPTKYWVAFGAVMSALIALIVGIGIATASSNSTMVMTPSELDQQLVSSGQWANSLGATATASSAQCEPSAVHGDGSGMYQCVVDFTDGSRDSVQVTVGSDGSWVTSH